MKKSTKIWIITAVVLILSGLTVFIAAMSAAHWDFTKLSNAEYKIISHEIQNEFHNIEIDISTANITFLPTDTDVAEVVCYEDEKMKYTVTVVNGTLLISEKDQRKWFDHIGIFQSGSPEITLYLPQNRYDALFIKSDTGGIHLYGINCNNLTVELDTGNMLLENVIAEKTFSLKSDTGDIQFIHSDAAEIFAETDTGDIFGILLSEKVFHADSSTGDISIPQTERGGYCELTTDTGDIMIELK